MVQNGGWRWRASACLLLGVVALTACGEQSDAEPDADPPASSASSPDETHSHDKAHSHNKKSAEPVPANAPVCSEIWTDGARIPRGYQGCADGGDYVARDSLACSSGQRMVRYGDRYYGVIGGTVHEAAEPLLHDRDFRDAVRSCRA